MHILYMYIANLSSMCSLSLLFAHFAMHIKLHTSSFSFLRIENRSPTTFGAHNSVSISVCVQAQFNYPFYKWIYFRYFNRVAPACREDEIECDNQCHPGSIRCNGVAECSDGYDEYGCPTTTTTTTTQTPEVQFLVSYPWVD